MSWVGGLRQWMWLYKKKLVGYFQNRHYSDWFLQISFPGFKGQYRSAGEITLFTNFFEDRLVCLMASMASSPRSRRWWAVQPLPRCIWAGRGYGAAQQLLPPQPGWVHTNTKHSLTHVWKAKKVTSTPHCRLVLIYINAKFGVEAFLTFYSAVKCAVFVVNKG